MAIILTLTANPAIDICMSTARVQPARKLRCSPGSRDPGGGGINVARVAARLGAQAHAIFPAGGWAGRELETLVRREGVQSHVTPIHGDTRQDITVLDETTKDEFRFVMPGPHLSGMEWMACLKAVSGFAGRPDFICASGSLPPGAPADFYARVAEIAALKGARFALDTSGAALKAALREHIHLIKPNLAELRELVGGALDEEGALVDACRDLIRGGRTEAVALTLGAQGALLVTASAAWRAAPLDIRPVSTVGAGDSFLGAMLWAAAEGMPLSEAFGYGAAAGAAALLGDGTELARAGDVHRLRERVQVEAIGGRVGVA